MKSALRSLTLSLRYLERLFVTAVRQGKEPVLVVVFPGLRLDCRLSRTGTDTPRE